MNRGLKIPLFLCFVVSLLFCLPPMKTQAVTQQEGGLEDALREQSGLAPRTEEPPPEEVTEEEMLEEAPPEEAPPQAVQPVLRPQQQQQPGRLPPGEVVRGGGAREGEELRQVVIDSLVNLNYTFTGSPDTFVLKYHIHLEGKVAASTAVVKGNATIATEVTGYLAKWPTGSCKLAVTIPDSPFEMVFRKAAEDKAGIELKFTNPISETWESQCSFDDAPGAKFNTKGDPEKWLAKALEKASPPLSRLTAPLTTGESSSMKFIIGKQTIKDPPIGSADIEGTGVITINPGAGG